MMLSLSECRARYWVRGLLAVSQLVFVNLVLGRQDFTSASIAYTQPLAFIAYFYVGCLIGQACLDGRVASRARFLFPVLFLAIVLASGTTNTETIAGLRGFGLFVLSILIVYCGAGVMLRGRVLATATLLGQASYGVYLLHPFVFTLLNKLSLPVATVVPGTALVALGLSIASYRLYENPLRNWAKYRINLLGAPLRAPAIPATTASSKWLLSRIRGGQSAATRGDSSL
jgi:peptidoglycan/LPS O-acetylase OafA/YrhL